MTDTDMTAMIETLAQPNVLQEKKAGFYGCLTGVMVCTWLLWIVPATWVIYHWAF